MLHFDDSSSDESGLEWFSDPTCAVSYNRLYDKDGSIAQITPTMEQAAYHAGVCRPSSSLFTYKYPNSFFYGLAISANNNEVVTPLQQASLVEDIEAIFTFHQWSKNDLWRITGHSNEAWPRGRKVDPIGTHPNKPVMDPAVIRVEVGKLL